MSVVQFLTRDGTPWEPKYLEEINGATCIGCGRCYKVCTQGVLKMMGMDEDGEPLEVDDDDVERMVMTIAAPGLCHGCGSCAHVCGSKSMKFIPASEALAA